MNAKKQMTQKTELKIIFQEKAGCKSRAQINRKLHGKAKNT